MTFVQTFPSFPASTRSLAKKYLTQEIYNRLIHLKTQNGFTLSEALRSGIENPDSLIGIYAGDEESYYVFDSVFYPIVKKYHKIKSTISAPMKSNLCTVDLPDPDPEHKYIISTRIRVARNLAGFPFTPIISSNDRRKVENQIIESLQNIEPPFIGKYNPIKKYEICDEELVSYINKKKQNIEVKFKSSFRKGDRFQESAGINRDWPDNRGVFESNDKKFMVWVNEEDHLRIISIDQTGNITEVFNRLIKAIDIIQKKLKSKQLYFAWKDDLGYLTACPSNLGTAMRAGVHIKLPQLLKHNDILESAAKKLKLQIRGTCGEKTKVEAAVFDISNSQRLGVTEQQCCKILYDGVCRIIELEKHLERRYFK